MDQTSQINTPSTPPPSSPQNKTNKKESTHAPTRLVRLDVRGQGVLVQLNEPEQTPRPEALLLHALLRDDGAGGSVLALRWSQKDGLFIYDLFIICFQ